MSVPVSPQLGQHLPGVVSHCGLNFPKDSHLSSFYTFIGHLYIYFGENVYLNPLPILKLVSCCSIRGFLYILNTSPLFDVLFAMSSILWAVFSLYWCPLKDKTFDVILVFPSVTFGVISKKPLPNPRWWKFNVFLEFCSFSFWQLAKQVTRFDLGFIYTVGWACSDILFAGG